MILIGIVVSIIVFSIIILVHEYGHFKTARIFGVKVLEFGLGIPPKAKKLWIDRYGTEYTLNWLPLGGFVRLKGENINTFYVYDKDKKLLNNETLANFIENNKDIFYKDGNKIDDLTKQEILKGLNENSDKDSLQTKAPYKQAIVMLAGIFMNFLLAFIIFTILFLIGVSPIGINDKIKTNSDLKLIPSLEKAIEIGLIKNNSGVYLLPTKGSIAQKSGINNYDLVLKSGDISINNYEKLKEIIGKNKDKELVFQIKRAINNCDITKNNNCEFSNIEIKITPDKTGKIGSYLIPNQEINKDFKYKFGIIDSVKYGFIETIGQINLTFKGLSIMIQKIFSPNTPTERQEALDQVSGPIGMVDFMSKSISNGIIFIVIIGAIISINLGVFNLLPIPALDGGRFLFITINSIIEKIFKKKLMGPRLEGLIHLSFFIFLIALSILIAYNDVNKIINN
ncbi:site-2 protease family protein [Candidatus Gracilibacteria bacterium]|nr:site-2 protease family protein [Candidatus Gracilibacteria bacterium]